MNVVLRGVDSHDVSTQLAQPLPRDAQCMASQNNLAKEAATQWMDFLRVPIFADRGHLLYMRHIASTTTRKPQAILQGLPRQECHRRSLHRLRADP